MAVASSILFNSIKIIESKKRYYPYQNFSQIIGYMGQPTQSSELYSKGVFHLERSYEKHLRGTPGKIFSEVNAKGKTIREISIEKSIKGECILISVFEKNLMIFGKEVGRKIGRAHV